MPKIKSTASPQRTDVSACIGTIRRAIVSFDDGLIGRGHEFAHRSTDMPEGI
jgi:hypothetical protein